MEKPVILYEQILLGRLKENDHAAFSLLFNIYYKDLVFFASSFTQESALAEEIVQDVFVKLWEDRKTLQITTSLKSYFLKSIQNKCLDWIRHLKVRSKHNEEVLLTSQLSENDTENYVLYSELEVNLKTALDKLPFENAEVFRLNRFESKTYQEIADILAVSVRVVELRMSKALVLLREELKDYLPALLLLLYFSNKS